MKYWITFEVDSPIDTEHKPGTKEFYDIVMERAFDIQDAVNKLSATDYYVHNSTQQKYEVTEWNVYDDENGKLRDW